MRIQPNHQPPVSDQISTDKSKQSESNSPLPRGNPHGEHPTAKEAIRHIGKMNPAGNAGPPVSGESVREEMNAMQKVHPQTARKVAQAAREIQTVAAGVSDRVADAVKDLTPQGIGGLGSTRMEDLPEEELLGRDGGQGIGGLGSSRMEEIPEEEVEGRGGAQGIGSLGSSRMTEIPEEEEVTRRGSAQTLGGIGATDPSRVDTRIPGQEPNVRNLGRSSGRSAGRGVSAQVAMQNGLQKMGGAMAEVAGDYPRVLRQILYASQVANDELRLQTIGGGDDPSGVTAVGGNRYPGNTPPDMTAAPGDVPRYEGPQDGSDAPKNAGDGPPPEGGKATGGSGDTPSASSD